MTYLKKAAENGRLYCNIPKAPQNPVQLFPESSPNTSTDFFMETAVFFIIHCCQFMIPTIINETISIRYGCGVNRVIIAKIHMCRNDMIRFTFLVFRRQFLRHGQHGCGQAKNNCQDNGENTGCLFPGLILPSLNLSGILFLFSSYHLSTMMSVTVS